MAERAFWFALETSAQVLGHLGGDVGQLRSLPRPVEHGQAPLALVGADLVRHGHALAEEVDDLVIDGVDAVAQLADVFHGGPSLGAVRQVP